jgi:hypothetical protein
MTFGYLQEEVLEFYNYEISVFCFDLAKGDPDSGQNNP